MSGVGSVFTDLGSAGIDGATFPCKPGSNSQVISPEV